MKWDDEFELLVTLSKLREKSAKGKQKKKMRKTASWKKSTFQIRDYEDHVRRLIMIAAVSEMTVILKLE